MLEEGSQFHFIGSFNLFQSVLPIRSSNKLTFPLYASERAQFNAQLHQLRDPGPGDNIGSYYVTGCGERRKTNKKWSPLFVYADVEALPGKECEDQVQTRRICK